MARVLIFANPIAGKGRGRAVARLLANHLVRRGFEVQTFLSKPEKLDCGDVADVKCAIVIGGDGTLRGVAQWAIEAYRGTGTGPASAGGMCIPYPLLIVPMGTANLMGRHLGIEWDEATLGRDVMEALEGGTVRQLDVARAKNGTEQGVFLLMAGIGFDAWIVHELTRVRAGPIDMTRYVLPAVRALVDYRFPRIEVEVDGKRVFKEGSALALVGNVKEYGTGFPMLPLAEADDGLLDVCVMPCETHAQLFQIAFEAAVGRHIRSEGVVYVKGKRVKVTSPAKVPVQVDGEAAGTTPLEIDLLPSRIGFIVPRTISRP